MFDMSVIVIGFPQFIPTISARHVLCKATCMNGVLAHVTPFHAVMLLDMLSAPRAMAIINERTGPLVSVGLIVTRMKMKVAICTMLCNAL